MRTSYFICGAVYRPSAPPYEGHQGHWCPTVVIDVDLRSWALPFAIHAGGPLLGKPGFHFRIGPVNIGWSKL